MLLQKCNFTCYIPDMDYKKFSCTFRASNELALCNQLATVVPKNF